MSNRDPYSDLFKWVLILFLLMPCLARGIERLSVQSGDRLDSFARIRSVKHLIRVVLEDTPNGVGLAEPV
jgi:hypothetical protein